MSRCLTTPDLLNFLSRLDVAITAIHDGIIIHATMGDVLWRWTGTMWCWG